MAHVIEGTVQEAMAVVTDQEAMEVVMVQEAMAVVTDQKAMEAEAAMDNRHTSKLRQPKHMLC